jgi:hypothetical protein
MPVQAKPLEVVTAKVKDGKIVEVTNKRFAGVYIPRAENMPKVVPGSDGDTIQWCWSEDGTVKYCVEWERAFRDSWYHTPIIHWDEKEGYRECEYMKEHFFHGDYIVYCSPTPYTGEVGVWREVDPNPLYDRNPGIYSCAIRQGTLHSCNATKYTGTYIATPDDASEGGGFRADGSTEICEVEAGHITTCKNFTGKAPVRGNVTGHKWRECHFRSGIFVRCEGTTFTGTTPVGFFDDPEAG